MIAPTPLIRELTQPLQRDLPGAQPKREDSRDPLVRDLSSPLQRNGEPEEEEDEG